MRMALKTVMRVTPTSPKSRSPHGGVAKCRRDEHEHSDEHCEENNLKSNTPRFARDFDRRFDSRIGPRRSHGDADI
ncbi:MAG: hypothetical protein PHQ85_05100 [Eubacteriales bacterium]|nr:hypothetical protein [Eubacteriales bacterium]MDD4105396.1 hypothetical protein [Eubacteriales bacterium]MDD4709887.1 hypothetical protein [Eubacteriales bacterium]NLO15336.1 hypothetical protein [Clostridiales bacterium]